MKPNNRFELKYRISLFQYYQIKNAIKLYMKPDKHTNKTKEGTYLVRSIYFDTFDFKAYHEKINDNYGRIKVRFRTYTDKVVTKPQVRVELKTRKGALMGKYSTFVSYPEYINFMKTGHWLSKDNKVLKETERLYHCLNLKPLVIVEYQREGYQARDHSNLRITFDHDVKYARSKDLFSKTLFFKQNNKKDIILEIKYNGKIPTWLLDLVNKASLKKVANSKYAEGVYTTNLNIVTPIRLNEILISKQCFDMELAKSKLSFNLRRL